jgi:hypothetical protein
MENSNEIVINAKVKKPLTEAQKEKQRETMRNYYLKKKADPEYIESKVKHIITNTKKKCCKG